MKVPLFCLLACVLSALAQTNKFTPIVSVITNDFKERETLIIWKTLPASSGGVLGYDMAFRSVVLKRVTFKGPDGLKAFDVTDLHPDVCEYHRIDVDAQLRKADVNNAAWANKERNDLITWKINEDARQIRLAKEAAERIEAARLAAIEREKAFQRELEERRVQAEEVRADAEQRKADALYENSQRPAVPGVIIQNRNGVYVR